MRSTSSSLRHPVCSILFFIVSPLHSPGPLFCLMSAGFQLIFTNIQDLTSVECSWSKRIYHKINHRYQSINFYLQWPTSTSAVCAIVNIAISFSSPVYSPRRAVSENSLQKYSTRSGFWWVCVRSGVFNQSGMTVVDIWGAWGHCPPNCLPTTKHFFWSPYKL